MLHKAMTKVALTSALLLASALGGAAHAVGQAPDDPAMQAVLDAWNRDYEVAMAARAQTLAQRGDVRSLLGAVMIMPAQDGPSEGVPGVLGPQARGWFERARQIEPVDALVAWVEVVDCHVLGCDHLAATARLLQIDGDNAAAHVWAISDAAHSGDLRGARQQLSRAASARRYDPHTSQLLRLLLDSRTGARLPAIDARVASVLAVTAGSANPADFIAVQSLGQWAAITLAPLQGVVRLCGPESNVARDPALRRDCVALLSMIAANESTLVHAKAAASLLIRMDPVLARQWTPRMRQLDWWQEQSLPLITDGNAAVPAREFARWIATDGELGALSRLLASEGVPAAPPADWNPSRRFR